MHGSPTGSISGFIPRITLMTQHVNKINRALKPAMNPMLERPSAPVHDGMMLAKPSALSSGPSGKAIKSKNQRHTLHAISPQAPFQELNTPKSGKV
jgi:hypothetical protein